jgi:pimeloyl-ACP methyl ester carboxylesterase
VKERAILVQQRPLLVGVLTEAAAPAGLPAVVLLNAGIVHRVGPNRLYVRMARMLAHLGFPVLRFDLSALGDSETGSQAESFVERAPRETREAMNLLDEETGTAQFVLIGLCSGAATAVRVAAQDTRVTGVVLVDPEMFPIWQFRVRYYMRRLLQWSSWRNVLTGQNGVGRLLRQPLRVEPTREENAVMVAEEPSAPVTSRELATAALRSLIDRGVKMCVIFSGVPSNYNYQKQFADSFPELAIDEHIQVEYFPLADHTFTRRHWQDELLSVVGQWAKSSFGTPESMACWILAVPFI